MPSKVEGSIMSTLAPILIRQQNLHEQERLLIRDDSTMLLSVGKPDLFIFECLTVLRWVEVISRASSLSLHIKPLPSFGTISNDQRQQRVEMPRGSFAAIHKGDVNSGIAVKFKIGKG